MIKNINPCSSEKILTRLPKHLKQFIVPQQYDQYTPINQAVWRFVMRKNISYLKEVAHESYIEGLKKAGIDSEAIPNIYGMNRILKEIGWAAVAVDGFIPPNAFMEFQANNVLVIASDIRQLKHIEYTPAPDIIHEASGHAPIIANPDYAEFLRRLGEIGAKAIMSKYDIELYEAVRELSILKEAAGVEKRVLLEAEKRVNILQNQEHEFSEMAKVRNMQWWSVEYGLIGGLETAKIYGAGLLSSIGESKWCMSDSVKKLPYTIDVVNMGFDITKPQPQLYVTPSFAHLMEVLEDFADTLSVRKGGVGGINKLIESQSVGTIELNTGLQISGVFSDVLVGENNEVVFFKTSGPTALSYREKELVGHGIKYHKDGYSSPLGLLKSVSLPLENMTPIDLKVYNIIDGQRLFFEFESGITVEGLNITGIRDVKGKIQIIKLEDCTVKYGDKILFKPEYGVYDMAIGSSVVSAFSGAADPESFENLYSVSKVKTISYKMSEKELRLNEIAEKIRLARQDTFDLGLLKNLFFKLKNEHPENWLLPLEILELTNNEKIGSKIEEYLIELSKDNKNIESLVQSGISMVKSGF